MLHIYIYIYIYIYDISSLRVKGHTPILFLIFHRVKTNDRKKSTFPNKLRVILHGFDSSFISVQYGERAEKLPKLNSNCWSVYMYQHFANYGVVCLRLVTWQSSLTYFLLLNQLKAGLSGRAIWGVDLRPLVCWDCGFESQSGQECLSLVSVVCCQVEVSATSWSLVQRSPTECGASLCVI